MRGHDPKNIALGNTLTKDQHEGRRFDYLISNPPFGTDWTKEKPALEREREVLGYGGRFGAGLPPKDDASLLFLQHMLSKMKPADAGGSRIAIVFNQAPLMSGDAGGGESEIRRWIIENDWLESVIAMPNQMFFNTDIPTYIWIVTNRKSAERQGQVHLIDGRGYFEPMPRSMGKKRKLISATNVERLAAVYRSKAEGEHSLLVRNSELGYRKLAIERPRRVRYEVTAEALAEALGKDAPAKASDLVGRTFESSGLLSSALNGIPEATSKKIHQLLLMCAVPDPHGEVLRDLRGRPISDPSLADTERVPLTEDVDAFLAEEVLPFWPEAVVAPAKEKVGYEIPITRLFYRPVSLRSLSEIDADIGAVEDEVRNLLEPHIPAIAEG